MSIILRITAVALVVGITAPAGAQRFPGYPGTHLTIDVRVASIAHSADSTRVTYILSNRTTSEEQLFSFTVPSDATVRNLTVPKPPKSWRVSTRLGRDRVARWTALDDTVMTPGKSSVPLAFTANGIPGIVEARFAGAAELPDIDAMEDGDPRLGDRALEVTSVPVQVVGVVASPSNPTRATLITRLLGLAKQTCSLGWTTDAQICAALTAYLNAPSPKLLSFLGTVVAARARPGVLNDNAYWLLRSNAEIVRDFVDVPGIRLTYLCGNTFQIQNPNFVPVSVRYEVVGTPEATTVTLPALISDSGLSTATKITVTTAGVVRLLYQGAVIQTVNNSHVACKP